ncbi:MAG: hypothetical protein AAFO06_21085 [Cyanobacteria bacterium J06597_16]
MLQGFLGLAAVRSPPKRPPKAPPQAPGSVTDSSGSASPQSPQNQWKH